MISGQALQNFGRNVSFRPRTMYQPKSEAEVLSILDSHRGSRIRVIGRLHSYSEAACCEDVLLDVRHLNTVRTEQRDGRVWATIGAGCQVKHALVELERQAGVTLPAVGLITEQSIAGAISTGTHGSGRHSLSHYIAEVRVATYDTESGEPVIRTINAGSELKAARCSLGCLGVIVSVGLWVRPQYCVEEHFRRYEALADVVAAEEMFPLQQFFLIPWRWDFWVQHRREAATSGNWQAMIYQAYFFAVMEVGLHLIVLVLSKLFRSRWATHTFFRRLLPLTVIRHWKVVGKSQDMLVMEHELFRHVEIEVFVKRSKLDNALRVVKELVSYFDGDIKTLSSVTAARMEQLGLLDPTDVATYTHCYPICVRRILPDDTLISMASSDDEDSYSISFNCYAGPSNLRGFNRFSEVLTRTVASLFEARPHWGKICPMDASTVKSVYLHLTEFRRVSTEFDPDARFRNDWVSRLLFVEPSKEA
ncbi:MAG: FAD-binding protein [Planctomyces sp.]|nr:FAD-binding protein [Planctomyces sp.]